MSLSLSFTDELQRQTRTASHCCIYIMQQFLLYKNLGTKTGVSTFKNNSPLVCMQRVTSVPMNVSFKTSDDLCFNITVVFSWLYCHFKGFLPCDAMLAWYICHSHVSVCLLSVTSWCSTETAKRRITHITPQNSLGALVFLCQRSRPNSNKVTPNAGAKCRWGRLKLATFDK